MTNDFSKVKKGDNLWSSAFGWVNVIEISHVIFVRTCKGADYQYDFQGRIFSNRKYPQSLFFEEMQLVPLPKQEESKHFDPSKPYQRRDGKYALIIHTKANGDYIVINSDEKAYIVNKEGLFDPSLETNNDLINVPMVEGWINVYKVHEDKASADADNLPIRMACIYVSFSEGEGL